MKRIQLFEFHDQAWFPQSWRDFMTDIMNVFDATFNPYRPVIPALAQALKKTGSSKIIDLCSGAGGPALHIQKYLESRGDHSIGIILTDKFPNRDALREICRASQSRIGFIEQTVDATEVPDDLNGFRTIFTSFHHFPPVIAKKILQDAVRKNEGIGIFEYTEKTWVWLMALLGMPLAFFLSAFMVKPFKWQRVLWAVILLPIIMFEWDSLVSCLRSYTAGELAQMAREIKSEQYQWETGRVHSFGGCYITYLMGYPEQSSSADPPG